jgi:chemotaxis protein MotB
MDEQAASGSEEFDLREAMQETEGPISIHIPGLPEMPSALPVVP